MLARCITADNFMTRAYGEQIDDAEMGDMCSTRGRSEGRDT